MNRNELLRVEGLSKSFSGFNTLRHVSFDLREGEILGIIGPNGAGKTTLLECLVGLSPVNSGKVFWKSEPLTNSGRKDVMFYLPEDIVPYQEQPASRLTGFFRDIYDLSHERERDVLVRLQVKNVLTRRIGELSRGYRRRLLLALALLTPKPLLLLDEPFDGLDPRQTVEVADLLREESAVGRTLVLSIHQLADAARIWSRSSLRLRDLAYSARANRTLVLHELRNVVMGRAFWVTMLALTVLVGYSFIQAVDLYSQASKSALEFPELARGMAPLEGILVPTLGALYLASTLFLPLIAIRAIARDKETGALKLLLQMPLTPAWLVTIKVAAVIIAIIALFLPALSFIPIWLYLGGHVHTPELLNLLAGHALYALNIVGIAFLAASLSDSLSTAAILALAVTLSFWIMDFAATASGGFLHWLSFYSLTAALHQFEQGLFSLSAVLAMLLAALGLFALTATWLPTGIAVKKKLVVSLVIVLLFSLAAFGLSRA